MHVFISTVISKYIKLKISEYMQIIIKIYLKMEKNEKYKELKKNLKEGIWTKKKVNMIHGGRGEMKVCANRYKSFQI